MTEDEAMKKLRREFPDVPEEELNQLIGSVSPRMSPLGAKIQKRYQALRRASRTAGSDGNYMTKQNLWLAHRVSGLLYKGIPDGKLLPDWAEAKINSAADDLKAVANWAMKESHGDDLDPGPEANPIHLAAEKTYTASKDLKFKDGTTLAKGTVVTVSYEGTREKAESMTLNHDGTTHKIRIENGHKYLKGFPKPPNISTLEKWSEEGIGKTPSGYQTEEDGHGPDGSPSWLLVMGLI